MQANQFFDETDVTTLLLMSTCVQDEMAELHSACIAYQISGEGITDSVDSVFGLDITIIVCQLSELENSLAALDRRIAQLEQARSRPEPYRVSNDDAALIRALVSDNAALEVDKLYAKRLGEMERQGKGRQADGVVANQLFDENTISRLKYQHMKEFEKMPMVYTVPIFNFMKALNPKMQGASSIEALSATGSSSTDTVPPIRRKPHQINTEMATPAQAVWLMRMPNLQDASGVFDCDITLVEGDVLEMTRSSLLSPEMVPIRGKGKGKAKAPINDEFFLDPDELTVLGEAIPDDLVYHWDLRDGSSSSLSRQSAKCGICFDDFRVTANPYRSALSATSSVDKNKGLEMPCGHKYCLGCASQYLKTEMEKQQPACEWLISCPECPPNDPSRTRFTEHISQTILGAENMEAWYFRDLQEGIQGIYCPNPNCSEFVEPPEGPQEKGPSTCPNCLEGICLTCNSLYHEGYTCNEYQELPQEERMREDKLLFDLLEKNNWVRCPGCGIPSERTSGCPHMTCTMCKTHYCYGCGGEYDLRSYVCKNLCNGWNDQLKRASRKVGWRTRSEKLHAAEQKQGHSKPADWKARLTKVFGRK